jgi:hypothetical protein
MFFVLFQWVAIGLRNVSLRLFSIKVWNWTLNVHVSLLTTTMIADISSVREPRLWHNTVYLLENQWSDNVCQHNLFIACVNMHVSPSSIVDVFSTNVCVLEIECELAGWRKKIGLESFKFQFSKIQQCLHTFCSPFCPKRWSCAILYMNSSSENFICSLGWPLEPRAKERVWNFKVGTCRLAVFFWCVVAYMFPSF